MYRLIAVVALMALSALALACGQEEEALPQTSETPVASSSPSPATATPAAEAAQTTAPSAQPSQAAGGKAPDGCLSTEVVYVDPAGLFAFCYPADMELITVGSGETMAPTVRHRQGDSNRVIVTFSWAPELRSTTGEPCLPSMLLKQNKVVRDFSVGGKTGKACFEDDYERDKSDRPTNLARKTIAVQVPLPDGYLFVDVTLTGPDWSREGMAVDSIATRILDSAVIN